LSHHHNQYKELNFQCHKSIKNIAITSASAIAGGSIIGTSTSYKFLDMATLGRTALWIKCVSDVRID